MKSKHNEILFSISLAIALIINVLCTQFLNIRPEWLNSIISIIISLISSIGIIYILFGATIHYIWIRIHKQINMRGKWYIAYYADQHSVNKAYLRIGSFDIKQNYESIEMRNLNGHTPVINNGHISRIETRDGEKSERSSSGCGFAQIDTSNNTLSGIYKLTRAGQHSIIGLWELTLTRDDNGIVRGAFQNKESNRPDNRPTEGTLIICRNKETIYIECERMINSLGKAADNE